jgi:hypothetical protein
MPCHAAAGLVVVELATTVGVVPVAVVIAGTAPASDVKMIQYVYE